MIAYEKDGSIIAIGNNAKKLVGKVADGMQLKYPLKNGAISDIPLTKIFIKEIFKEKGFGSVWKNAIVLITCPISITKLERDSLEKMCKDLGTSYTEVQDDIKLGLIGSGNDIYDTKGRLILDLGAGITTIGVVAAGKTIIGKSAKFGGNYIDTEIQKYIKSNYSINIGLVTAEEIKSKLGDLSKNSNNSEMIIYGRDVVSCLPKEVYVSGHDIHMVLISIFRNIVNLVTETLGEIKTGLVKDTINNGITIIGGLTELKGLKEFIYDCFKLEVKVAKDAKNAVINGAVNYEQKIKNNYNGIVNKLTMDNK